MIPAVLAQQVRRGLEDYLEATFPITTPFFHDLLERFLQEPGNLFKGPFVSVGLPFRKGGRGRDFFPDLPLPFPAHLHQEKAFLRLSGPSPRPTIVATGTGSGKTECFLYPILDYCRKHRGEKGIKAILIYPMNALANDQAIRLARTIWDTPALKNQVTAGLYVGQREADPAKVMSRDRIITDREILRKQPPDILLTNYKMLDYLLIRPKDLPLWAHQGPETLRFLVVDELHTFDGAQGTDLACLIRRLKERLHTPEGWLCPVGTSATLGDASSAAQLLAYAGNIFGESFTDDAIIAEDRLSPGEFLEDAIIDRVELPPREALADLAPRTGEPPDAYVGRQAVLWFGEELSPLETNLAERLRSHLFFQNFLKILRDRIMSFDDLVDQLGRYAPGGGAMERPYAHALLASLMAMVSMARRPAATASGHPEPFLQVRFHLWARELRRLVAEVAMPSRLRFLDDLKEEDQKRHLPIVHCRECGATGWIGLSSATDTHLRSSPTELYQQYFERTENVTFLFPLTGSAGEEIPAVNRFWICPSCLHLEGDRGETPSVAPTGLGRPHRFPVRGGRDRPPPGRPCPSCGESGLLPVFRPDPAEMIVGRGRERGRYDCPYCQGSNSFSIIGSQAATMTSVMVSQLFASAFNDDRKLLTFSDSVQDAAHRAGFFGARTWQFTFRAALLQAIERQGTDLPLPAVATAFQDWWSHHLAQEAYVTMFLPPGMSWFRDFEAMKATGKLPAGSWLPRFLERRLNWEITAEFGFSARIGRSLERQEAAILYPDLPPLELAVTALSEALANEIGGFPRELPREVVLRFVAGLCDHLRHVGAIFHPELDGFIKDGTDTFFFHRQRPPIMPRWGPAIRVPCFPGKNAGRRYLPIVRGQGQGKGKGKGTWFQQWVERALGGQNPLVGGCAEQVLRLTFKALGGAGILSERPAGPGTVWGLEPAAMRVTTTVSGFTCSRCGHRRTGATCLAPALEGSPCLRAGCLGRYALREPLPDYYASLYRTAELHRIMAQEHTGLLTRDEREDIEKRFKQPDDTRKPWDPNLLSCTPTLEMGIDIGDLSSMVLCSIPPGKANFVQRVGRTGRRDGNSLCLALANARPHDLYFYGEPGEMLLGQVEPPGVFLGASAVLERQLTAWCFDRWVETGLPLSAIPPKIGTVLNQVDSPAADTFPRNFLDFLTKHQTALCDSFFARFGKDLSPESIEHLKTFALGDRAMEGSLGWKILQGLELKKKERDSLARRVNLLRERVKKMREDPAKGQNHEDDLQEMVAEQEALTALLGRLNSRDTLNFFTEEGLLPNYAFPEAGVTLRSVIYWSRDNPVAGGRRYDNLTQEFERSAGSALSELAPSSEFFGGGRHVKIDQVDMAVSEIEVWRLCAECSYMELQGTEEEKKTCPRCGDTMWADEGRKHRLIRLRQVIATTRDSDSRIGDDRDDRPMTFFHRRTSIDAPPSHVEKAWAVEREDFPFGYEFLRKAMFREVNFGEKDLMATSIKAGGEEVPVRGFSLCRSCGKVQLPGKDGIQHALTCTSRQQDDPTCLIDCVYLYRDFSSEALRILLPIRDTPWSEKRIESFLAALHMGLKLKFAGNIDHLQATLADEPVAGLAYRRKYVVLYDAVPGGTGYLKQLMEGPDTLMEVFDLALQRLRSCSCVADPRKDGCYRCLFAYRAGFRLEKLSRDLAIDFLASILAERTNLKPIENLDKVSIDKLADSPLEEMFLEALRRHGPGDPDIHLRKEVVNNKPGFHYRIGTRTWLIELHAKIGPAQGVNLPCETDFLIFPERSKDPHPPIAVFTDGFAFHHDRIDLDLAQRRALLASGKYLTWSLTYQDVEEALAPVQGILTNLLDPAGWPSGQTWGKMLAGFDLQAFQKVPQEGAMAMLKRYLAAPDPAGWRRLAFAHTLIWFDRQTMDTEELRQQVADWIGHAWSVGHAQGIPRDCLVALRTVVASNHDPSATDGGGSTHLPAGAAAVGLVVLAAGLTGKEMATGKKDGFTTPRILALLQDADTKDPHALKPFWNGFLKLLNVFQFLPRARFATPQSLTKYPGRHWEWEWDSVLGATNVCESVWKEAIELALPGNADLMHALAQCGVPVPEVGYELADAAGTVVAQAELAWPEKQVAIVDDPDTNLKPFQQAGWKVADLAAARQDPAQVKAWWKP